MRKNYSLYTDAIRDGRRAAHGRGHTMGNALQQQNRGNRTGSATCKRCGAMLHIDTSMKPAFYGAATTSDCGGER